MLVLQNVISEELYSENGVILDFNTLDEALDFKEHLEPFIKNKLKVVEVRDD